MGVRNKRKESLERLSSKTLDARFLHEVQYGLNCSPFEAEAVLQVVKEVYLPFFSPEASQAPPGKVTPIAVDADEPAGKSIAECEKRNVCVTVHRGQEDDRLLQHEGPTTFRRARIPDICQEALSQGALLTREDLVYRIFFVSPRTISRDLSLLRKEKELIIPLRSTVHDIGPVLTHRTEIGRLALKGKTTTEICRITRHSPEAVTNYTPAKRPGLHYNDFGAVRQPSRPRQGRSSPQKNPNLTPIREVGLSNTIFLKLPGFRRRGRWRAGMSSAVLRTLCHEG